MSHRGIKINSLIAQTKVHVRLATGSKFFRCCGLPFATFWKNVLVPEKWFSAPTQWTQTEAQGWQRCPLQAAHKLLVAPVEDAFQDVLWVSHSRGPWGTWTGTPSKHIFSPKAYWYSPVPCHTSSSHNLWQMLKKPSLNNSNSNPPKKWKLMLVIMQVFLNNCSFLLLRIFLWALIKANTSAVVPEKEDQIYWKSYTNISERLSLLAIIYAP